MVLSSLLLLHDLILRLDFLIVCLDSRQNSVDYLSWRMSEESSGTSNSGLLEPTEQGDQVSATQTNRLPKEVSGRNIWYMLFLGNKKDSSKYIFNCINFIFNFF